MVKSLPDARLSPSFSASSFVFIKCPSHQLVTSAECYCTRRKLHPLHIDASGLRFTQNHPFEDHPHVTPTMLSCFICIPHRLTNFKLQMTPPIKWNGMERNDNILVMIRKPGRKQMITNDANLSARSPMFMLSLCNLSCCSIDR